MFLCARENFCKLFLITAGTTPNFGHGLRVGTDIWKKIFHQKLHQLTASGSACGRDRRVRRGWQAAETLGQPGDYISSAPTTLDAVHSRWRSARARFASAAMGS